METHDHTARRAKLTLAGLAVLAAAGLAAGGVAAYSLLGNDDSGKRADGQSVTAKPEPSATGSNGGGRMTTCGGEDAEPLGNSTNMPGANPSNVWSPLCGV